MSYSSPQSTYHCVISSGGAVLAVYGVTKHRQAELAAVLQPRAASVITVTRKDRPKCGEILREAGDV